MCLTHFGFYRDQVPTRQSPRELNYSLALRVLNLPSGQIGLWIQLKGCGKEHIEEA